MAAIEHRFHEPLPGEIYLDTDIITSHLVRTQPHHQRAAQFVERMAQGSSLAVTESTLSWVEFGHVVSRNNFRQALPNDLSRDLLAGPWERRSVRQIYLRLFTQYMRSLLEQFTWSEVHLTPDVRDLALDLMADYALGSQDAVHLASASLAGVQHFASFDVASRRVDGLHLWNDLIHS